MEATHTPGPLRMVRASKGGPETIRVDIVTDGLPFAPSFVAGDVLPADAALFCAAPDLLAEVDRLTAINAAMLAALEAALAHLDNEAESHGDDWELRATLTTAIREGEAQP